MHCFCRLCCPCVVVCCELGRNAEAAFRLRSIIGIYRQATCRFFVGRPVDNLHLFSQSLARSLTQDYALPASFVARRRRARNTELIGGSSVKVASIVCPYSSLLDLYEHSFKIYKRYPLQRILRHNQSSLLRRLSGMKLRMRLV